MSGAEPARLAAEWLSFARDDLRAAERMAEEPERFRPRHAAFSAQQAAEKAIKAVLVAEQIDYPFTHDLEALATLVPAGWEVRERRPDLAPLSEWAVVARYPGAREPTVEEAAEAIAVARAVVAAVEHDFEQRGSG